MSSISITPSLVNPLDSTSSSTKFSQMKQAWQQLSESLQSGDLAGAQTAFATITSLQQQTSGSASHTNNSQLSKDMQSLGQALQSGNLSAAQSAFAAVQNDLKSTHGRHHHGGSASASAGTEATGALEELLSSGSTANSPTSSNTPVSTYA